MNIIAVMIISVLVFALAMAGMAIGAAFGRKPLAGSCGGDSTVRLCGACNQEKTK